jgi:hypothetical protein
VVDKVPDGMVSFRTLWVMMGGDGEPMVAPVPELKRVVCLVFREREGLNNLLDGMRARVGAAAVEATFGLVSGCVAVRGRAIPVLVQDLQGLVDGVAAMQGEGWVGQVALDARLGDEGEGLSWRVIGPNWYLGEASAR